MNAKTGIRIGLGLFVIGSLGYLAIDSFTSGSDAEDIDIGTGYGLFYFTQGKDCSTCDNIEAYALEAMQTHFSPQLEDGTLAWKKIDTDQPEHAHFNTDLNLYTKSIVLMQYEDGKLLKWKNLEKVWDLVYEKPAYLDYIQTSTSEFLSETQ
jgi:hypothetical protein